MDARVYRFRNAPHDQDMTSGRTMTRDGVHSKWILQPRPNPSAVLRLFCFPYAGVGSSVFRTWVGEFDPMVELCFMQPPGREGRFAEPPMASAHALARSAADAMAPYLDSPFAFFGHSLGALTAFEVARELRRRHQPLPLHLFASAHRTPDVPNPHPALRQLPDERFIEEIARNYGGIPQQILDSRDLLALMLPCLRADFTAFETYQHAPEPPLPCPITAFGGRADRRVREFELTGWNAHTSKAFRLEMFDGNHFFVQSAKDALLTSIRRDLTAAIATAAVGR
jgi:medium-chain acyl-[acyl-carrier-protein] hydrolase